MNSHWKEVVQGNRRSSFGEVWSRREEREECANVDGMYRIKKVDYKHLKGGDMREWKQTGDQCWCRLARPLGAFRQRRKSWEKKKR